MDPLLPPPNSKKRNLGERKPGFLLHFCFLKTGRYREGQFFAENDVTEEKTFHFRILGDIKKLHEIVDRNIAPVRVKLEQILRDVGHHIAHRRQKYYYYFNLLSLICKETLPEMTGFGYLF